MSIGQVLLILWRRGWIAVLIDSAGKRSFHILDEIAMLEELAENVPYIAMIDIPIGLPDSGYRDCDLSARRMLGKACNRVPRAFAGDPGSPVPGVPLAARFFTRACKQAFQVLITHSACRHFRPKWRQDFAERCACLHIS